MKINLFCDLDGPEVQALIRVYRQDVGLQVTGHFWNAVSEHGEPNSGTALLKKYKLSKRFERQGRIWKANI
jgi:hypothetical protein